MQHFTKRAKKISDVQTAFTNPQATHNPQPPILLIYMKKQYKNIVTIYKKNRSEKDC